MKRTHEILGLPIISISDGMEVGRVKSLIINAEKGAIDYVVVDSGIQILSATVIATENVLGIGEYALTIENEGSINDISKIPAAIDLLQKNILVKGTKVLTKKGRLIGEIGDIYVDEDACCKITGLEYIADVTQKKIRIIPRQNVITFGKNLIVVTDDVENALLDNADQLDLSERVSEEEKKNPFDECEAVEDNSLAIDENIYVQEVEIIEQEQSGLSSQEVNRLYVESRNGDNDIIDEDILAEDKAADIIIDKDSPELKPGSSLAEESQIVQPKDEGTSANLFEQRQRQYLIGRRSTKTITDNSGSIIITEGTIISDDVIDNAKASGKLIELVMNNKA